jgi:hypothetical protein
MVSFKVVSSDSDNQILTLGSLDNCYGDVQNWQPVTGFVLGLYFENTNTEFTNIGLRIENDDCFPNFESPI